MAVFGDLIPAPAGEGALAAPSTDLKRRVMRARFPVIDFVSPEGPILRLAAGAVAWRGLRGAGLSSPLNLVALLERLGVRVDFGFTGIGPLSEPAGPVPEGAHVQASRIFDGYARAWARRLSRGEALPAVTPAAPAPIPSPEAVLAGLGLASHVPDAVEEVPPFQVEVSLAVALAALVVAARAPPLVGCAVLGVAAGWSFRRARVLRYFRERFAGYRPTTPRGLTAGRVRLSGAATGQPELLTPLTAIPCLAVRWTIEARDERRLAVVERGDRRLPFLVEAGDARVKVNAEDAALLLDPLRSGTERVTTEWSLLPGAPVVVYGVARRTPEPEVTAHAVLSAASAARLAAGLRWEVLVQVTTWFTGAAAAIELARVFWPR